MDKEVIKREVINKEVMNKEKWFQDKAGKGLLLFIIIIIVFTVISRVASSFTVALVSANSPKRDALTYKVTGEGKVGGAKEQYMDIEANLKVDDVLVKIGQRVEAGDMLFVYSIKDMKEQLDSARNEYEVSKRNYEKVKLTGSLKEDTTSMKSVATVLERAREDELAARLNLEDAKRLYKETVKDITKNLSKQKEEEYRAGEKAYESARKEYDTIDETCAASYQDMLYTYKKTRKEQDRAIKSANGSIVDAQQKLDEVTYKQTKLLEHITVYEEAAKKKDYETCSKRLNSIYIDYFGKSKYEQICKEIRNAEKNYDLANEHLAATIKKWNLIMEEETRKLNAVDKDSKEYPVALNAYNQQLLLKETEIKADDREVDTARAGIDLVSEKYIQITNAATTYRDYLATNSSDSRLLHDAFYSSIIDSTVMDEKGYAEANRALERAKISYQDLILDKDELTAQEEEQKRRHKHEWEQKLEKAQEKVDESEENLEKILGKTYENKEGIRTARADVNVKREAVKTAKRGVTDALNAYDMAQQSLQVKQENTAIHESIAQLELLELQEVIKKKKQNLDKLQQLYNEKGIVKTSIAGVVTQLEITPKVKSGGNEKVAITPNGSEFSGVFDKEYREYVEVGDTVECKLASNQNKVEATVLQVVYNQDTDNYTLSTDLPEKEYVPGTSGTFRLVKASPRYNSCVPITAIRKDNEGTFVLLMEQKDTVLGKENIAVRVNVEIIKKDYEKAAIAELLSPSDQVIVGSNREIKEGDRVRVGSYE